MVEGKRADLRRIGQEQNTQYKRTLAFVIFLIASLSLITATFLNPFFMKKQIRTSYNEAVVVRQVNKGFNSLADLVGASNSKLANQILTDIDKGIDKGSSSGAQEVNSKLKKQKSNALYAIIRAFNLNIVTLGANIAGLLFIVNIIIIIVTIISMISLLNDMKTKSTVRMLIHDIAAAGMWAGFWLILIFGLMAIVPVIFDVDNIEFGFLLEIGSSVFLDYVITGVIIYVICAIPWQATAAK